MEVIRLANIPQKPGKRPFDLYSWFSNVTALPQSMPERIRVR
jgi:hypothetical protein